MDYVMIYGGLCFMIYSVFLKDQTKMFQIYL